MSLSLPTTSLQLRSLVRRDGTLRLSLDSVAVPAPGSDEVVVRIEAAPINPSDLGLLIGPADMRTARLADGVVTVEIPPHLMPAMAARLDQPLPVGNEGAGTVVAAGASDAARALLGKTVAVIGGAIYAQYRTVPLANCLLLPPDATARDGASCYVNPLTALGMLETMRREGHTALVHTAAASNLGRILNRLCLAEGIQLVNIVRGEEQAAVLRELGAVHICNSSAPSFTEDLQAALDATGATLAFDAIGGGPLASQILNGMEIAANRSAAAYSRYGSAVHKQVYIYGALDTRPTQLNRAFGFAWSVGGWLLFPFLQKVGPAEGAKLRARVAAELKTTFASHYSNVISLTEALQPEVIASYSKRATGEKYLIDPTL